LLRPVLLAFSSAVFLSGCGAVLVAAGAGAVGGYYIGKHYTVKVEKR
jgi:uncharacterized protein YceK